MKQLENRTLDSKIELEIMDALDEIKAVNRRHETVDTADVLKASAARREKSADGLVSGFRGSSRTVLDTFSAGAPIPTYPYPAPHATIYSTPLTQLLPEHLS